MELFVLVSFWVSIVAGVTNLLASFVAKSVRELATNVFHTLIQTGWCVWAGILLWGN